MPNKYKYGSISLRNKTLSKLKTLSSQIANDEQLSSAKTVEKLINDRLNNSEKGETTKRIINVVKENQKA
jgi:hypothetical protein